MAKPKRPTDVNQRAKLIIDIVIGEVEEQNPDKDKNPKNIAKGRKGGLKGGKGRAEKLTSEQRKEIASKAAKKRWSKNN